MHSTVIVIVEDALGRLAYVIMQKFDDVKQIRLRIFYNIVADRPER